MSVIIATLLKMEAAMQEQYSHSEGEMVFAKLIRDGDAWLWMDFHTYIACPLSDATKSRIGVIPVTGESPADTSVKVLTLRSQLYPCAMSKHHGQEYVSYPADIQAIDNCPVLLASVLSYPDTAMIIQWNRPYPPPEHGTAALIGEKIYYIADLPTEAQERQKKLRETLEDYAIPPDDLLEQMQTIPIFTEEERSTEGLSSLTEEPEELRNMLQQLAQDYYQLHQIQKQVPKKRALPHTPNVFEQGSAITSSCLPLQAVIASIHNAKSLSERWENPEDHAPFFHYEKPSGSTIVEYKTGEKNEVFDDKTTASLWRQVKTFSDDDADIVLALFAHLIHPSESDGTTWFLASQYLDYRGITPIMKADTPGGNKRRAGHRQEDIKAVGDSIGRIENIWITLTQWIDKTASGKKKRKRTEFTHKGRLLMVEEAYTQRELPEGDKGYDPGMEIAWRVRPGSWLRTFLESPNRQVANLCQKSLQYDPYRQQWEKRLARYFMFHGHINTRGGGGTFNRVIDKMLQEISLEINEERPQRTRDRFEKAMNTLVNDKIIEEWYYEAELSLPAKGWLKTWLEQKITVYIAPTRDMIGG